jgi:hypothetical protein
MADEEGRRRTEEMLDGEGWNGGGKQRMKEEEGEVRMVVWIVERMEAEGNLGKNMRSRLWLSADVAGNVVGLQSYEPDRVVEVGACSCPCPFGRVRG